VTATIPPGLAVDPVTFEIIRHKLNQVVDEAMDALRNVSGSPTTNEGNDLMVSLYRADGGLMLGGVGFLHHLTSASQAVKHILATFAEDPGIHEGDVFMLNDSYTAALHPPDIYIMSPVYWEGEMQGFVANFVHATDIGAVDAGGFSPNARSSYQEGFVTKGLKIVEGGRPRRDVIDTYLNQVREPGLVALDLKSQLAANHAAAERLHELYAEYGPDTVDAVSSELIERSERALRARLAELPDGTWRVVQYVDWPDRLHRVELAMAKRGDELVFDFTGTGPQSELGVNNAYWATLGGTFAPIYPLLAWDLTWNEGLMSPVSIVVPEGSLVNCTKPAPISVATVAMIKVVNDIVSLLIGRMLAASDRYRHRAMAVWDGAHSAISMVGEDATGTPFIAYSTDAFAGAGGARADRDGIDIGGEIPNGVSRWANAETHELGAPLAYLFRRSVPDSGGPGKFRGGVTHEFAFTPHGSGPDGIQLIVMTKGLSAPLSSGLSGGLPGNLTGSTIFRGAGAESLPGDQAVGGEPEITVWGEFRLGIGDVFYHRFQGGGGYGDPIDRDPMAVLADVVAGLVTAPAAAAIYGVVVREGVPTPSVDAEATIARRMAVRAERLGRLVTADEAVRRPPPPSGRPIGEYLQVTADGATQCTWCGVAFAGPGQQWRDAAHRADQPLTAAGAHRESAHGIVLRLSCCPTCGTLLTADTGLPGDPLVHDEVGPWP
jgi:N-methylhydantoinase B